MTVCDRDQTSSSYAQDPDHDNLPPELAGPCANRYEAMRKPCPRPTRAGCKVMSPAARDLFSTAGEGPLDTHRLHARGQFWSGGGSRPRRWIGLRVRKPRFPMATGNGAADVEPQVQAQLAQLTSPWFRYLLTYGPFPALRKLDRPVVPSMARRTRRCRQEQTWRRPARPSPAVAMPVSTLSSYQASIISSRRLRPARPTSTPPSRRRCRRSPWRRSRTGL